MKAKSNAQPAPCKRCGKACTTGISMDFGGREYHVRICAACWPHVRDRMLDEAFVKRLNSGGERAS